MIVEGPSNIKDVSTWDSGGGITLGIVELKDGRILAISEDVIVLYESMEELASGDSAAKRPQILL